MRHKINAPISVQTRKFMACANRLTLAVVAKTIIVSNARFESLTLWIFENIRIKPVDLVDLRHML